ncbi:hypothetical protein [Chitinimonas sp. BJYL2]|uniref:hypothetical protein n=1 Tax=Chitinimonas sp. BJYL2 TaxID=2976696 RepID=UPI0022B3BBCD|nr:hypothetical protein [Chitinimonas sp. BJYL2]
MIILAAAVAGHLWSVSLNRTAERQRVDTEAAVYLPPAAQLALAGGDRYVAANVNTLRALMVGTHRLKPETYQVLGLLQRDAARFNPGHEDNYYIATAILPWAGQLTLTQEILSLAMQGRPYDMYPPFFYGFHQLYFNKDPEAASTTVRLAARRMNTDDKRKSLDSMAIFWAERGDLSAAEQTLLEMAKSTRNRDYAAFLRKRAQRINRLAMLRSATTRWQTERGHPPPELEALVSAGYVATIPQDPLGGRFVLDKSGKPVVQER